MIITPLLPTLGVNIDHIATLRELRGTAYPDLLTAARLIESAGGQQITVHLREDRRHIQDDDVEQLRGELKVPLNLEMATTEEMVRFALKIRPDWVCLVPEKRNELTTEGGLNLAKGKKKIAQAILKLRKAGIQVSLFIEPEASAVKLGQDLGADAVELHTGKFCLATQGALGPKSKKFVELELKRILKAASVGRSVGLHVHAGHGLDYENIRLVVAAVEDPSGRRGPLIEEYNIGHSIVCRAALVGLERAVREMLSSMHAP